MAIPNTATASKTATTSAAVNAKLLAGAVASQSAIASSINTAKLANLTDNIKSEVAGLQASLQNVPQQIQGSIRNGIGTNPTKSFSSAGADATFNAIHGALTPKFNTGSIGQKSEITIQEAVGGAGAAAVAAGTVPNTALSLVAEAVMVNWTESAMARSTGFVIGGAAAQGVIGAWIAGKGIGNLMERTNFLYVNDIFQAGYGAVLGDGSDKTPNPLNDTSSTPFQLQVTNSGIVGKIQIKSKPGNSTPTGLDQDVITGVFLTSNEAKAFSDTLFKAQGGQKGTPDPLTNGGGVVVDLKQLDLLAQGGGAAGPIEGGSRYPVDGSPLVGSGSSSPGTGSGFPGGFPGVPTVFAGSIATAGMANFSLALNASVAHL